MLRVLFAFRQKRQRSTEKTQKHIALNHKMPMSTTSIKILCVRLCLFLEKYKCASKNLARMRVRLYQRLRHV